ncbi:rCG61324 [Rattus norvegicus]|uniref:RCG61324 n=1 Tax=Rattus norvegicus TaxID=10116 RepID=A6H9D3_RAT|nr:rCG61324 [Rattus norvegicus]
MAPVWWSSRGLTPFPFPEG